MQGNNGTKSSSGKRVLIFVVAIFVIPVAASMLMYLSGWRPAATGNHGQLIQPVRKIEDKALQTLEGKPVRLSELHGKWTMVYFGSSACNETCIKSLYAMRQIHVSQGKEMDRLQRVFILTDGNEKDALKAKLTDYSDMHVWMGDKKTLSALAQGFRIPDGKLAEDQGIYLIDPAGNLMMRYAPGFDPAGMRKDLARLLKYSWVG